METGGGDRHIPLPAGKTEATSYRPTTTPPTAHPLDLPQRLRPDIVTETDQRELFQSIAPAS